MNRLSAVRLAFSGMLALAIAIGVGRFAFTPILPMMQKDHGLTLRIAGLLASTNYVGYFIGALSAIWIRAATVTVVRFSVVTVALLTGAMGLTHHPFAWLLLRGLAGLVSAWILVFASAYILEQLATLGRRRLGGVVFGGVGFGTALTGASCLLFLNLSWSADQAWIAVGVIALALAFSCWPGYREATQTRAATKADASPLRLRTHMLVVVCYGIFGFGYIIPGTFLPAMAKQSIPDPAVFGWAWPIFGSAALISTLMAGWLSAHLPNRLIWASSHVVMAIGVAMPVLLPGMAGIVISACCVGGTFMVATMTGMQEARVLAPDHASHLMAAMTAAFGMGQIFGPLLVSLMGDLQNGMNALLLGASALLLGSAVALFRR
ncbi:MAG: YbfB/YjiJ family MFS transporter [Betaproteobacteria bacterium]|nr:YbfB/YjiJ family MFS transporter [Betaproteobacteria bacterium]